MQLVAQGRNQARKAAKTLLAALEEELDESIHRKNPPSVSRNAVHDIIVMEVL